MPSERKIQIVNSLSEKLAKAKGLVLTSFEGLSVPEVEVLRKNLRETGADYQIVKNTLLNLALKKTNYQLPTTSYQLTGPTAVVLSYEDEIKPLKALNDFAKGHGSFTIKGGFFAGAWLVAEKLKELAGLPGREALMAKLTGMLQSPLVRFVSVGKANQAKLVQVLGVINQKDSEESVGQ